MKIIKHCEKREDQEYYSFEISTNDGTFEITFAGNLDLYWNYPCKFAEKNNISEKTFRITAEDSFLYDLLLELYDNIKNYNIYEEDVFKEHSEEIRESLIKSDEYNPRKLFNNEVVDWHSDDYDYNETSKLVIFLDEDDIIIKFVKGITDYKRQTFAVRICNNGSRHDPFNVCFMRMYNKLIDYVPDREYKEEFHQISINEYMKLTRKK